MSQSQVERLDLTTQKQTKKRFFIVFLLFVTVVINYLDRANLSIAAPAMMRDLELTTEQIGWIFSAWGLSYACFQIPAGWLVDKFKPKYFLAAILILWSIATVIIGFVSNFLLIIALRFIVGMFEAPSYPINSKIVTNWIPENERASSIAVYTSAQFVGLAFLAPVLSWILMTYDWHMVFIVTGAVGILWAIYWLFAYNEPKDFPGISDSELEYLKDNGALLDEQVAEKKTATDEDKSGFWGDLLYIVTRRKIIGTCIGQFALGSATIFFLTWFPTYLVEYHNLSFIKAGFMASLPFLCGFLGVLCSGFTSDYLLKKGYSLATARKTPIITGLLLTSTIIGAEFFQSTTMVVVFMSIAFFATGLASITWSLVASLAPKRLIGLTGGVFNFIGGLSAVITPAIIGYLADGTSFFYPLLFIVSLGFIGALSYIFLVGKIERIEDRV